MRSRSSTCAGVRNCASSTSRHDRSVPVSRPHALPRAAEHLADVVVGSERDVDGAGDAQPGHDRVVALGVDPRLGEQHVLAALLVVVGGLEQRRALAAVHRAVAEVELRHYCR